MKGLIRNNFYSMEGNLRISFFIALFLFVISLFVENRVFIPMIVSMQLFVFIVNVGTSLHADVVSKWNKFECTLPVKFNDIIKAKYLSFVILLIFGIIMGSITVTFDYIINGSLNINSIIYGYEFGLILSSITAGIMYPIVLKIGTEKNEMIMILSSIASIGVLILVATILSPFIGEMNMRNSIVGFVSTIVALLILLGSYFVSLKIYKNKEFA